MQYQKINEALAKGTKIEHLSVEDMIEIENANKFLLLNEGEKPSWLEDFLDSNKRKMIETICRATSVEEGISSLKGYREGYFNEIVQNANDLQNGDFIDIKVDKEEDICKLDCNYLDKGFQLSNIYAFLNREMSDKSAENGQTGKFGVGIKSFFKFVDCLTIHSNIIFDFQVKRLLHDVQVYGTVDWNSNWDMKHTSLSIQYNSNNDSKFNTRKLTNLIEFLCGKNDIDFENFFVTGEDNEIVFDIRSLMFMKLNHLENTEKKSISNIRFIGNQHILLLTCKDKILNTNIEIEENIWNIRTMEIAIVLDDSIVYKKEYIIFKQDNISFAFPLNTNLLEVNRIYATYFLKKDNQERILPIGMLINSDFSNIHRTDVGDSEESICKIYKFIREKMLQLYECMCSEEVTNLSCSEQISDIFHSLLIRYAYQNKMNYMESPFHSLILNNANLPKYRNDKVKPYVVVHKSKELYETVSYMEGDIIRELRENYIDFVEEKNVYDYSELVNHDNCISGVKRLYTVLFYELQNENNEWKENFIQIRKICNYYTDVKSFLSFIIARERKDDLEVTDADIDRWLMNLEKKVGKYFNPLYFLKLVGRYELNLAINFDGTIKETKLSFKDYLFNNLLWTKEGILAQYQNKHFDEKYAILKKELLKKRYVDNGNEENKFEIRCTKPKGKSLHGWNGTFNYIEMSSNEISKESLTEPELLLEKLATDSSFDRMIQVDSDIVLFEKEALPMWRRDYSFQSFVTIKQQMINLSCLKRIKLNSFSKFIEAIQYRRMLEEDLAANIRITCEQYFITTQEIINYLLPTIVQITNEEKTTNLLEDFQYTDVLIKRIEENSNNEIGKEKREFISKIIGKNIHLYRFDSKTRRKIIAYVWKDIFKIKIDISKEFQDIASYNENTQDVYIFYDNFDENIQNVISIVLEQIEIDEKTLELLNGYICNKNSIKTMNYISRRRNFAKTKKEIVLDWCKIGLSDIPSIYDNEVLYRLLTARGSYDIFCPICADVPIETFDYMEETKKSHNRKIIVLENDNKDTKNKIPYIITVACSYCFEKLKNTLYSSEFDGENLILTIQVAHGQHEKIRNKKIIELSPINIELMKKFKVSASKQTV